MQLNEKTFRSKVARRIFALFIAGAFLPISVLAVLSFYQVSSQLREQGLKQLSHASKTAAMTIFHNLEIADTDLQLLAAEKGRYNKAEATEVLSRHFQIVTVFEVDKQHSVLGPPMMRPEISVAEMKHLSDGKSLLRVVPCPSAPQSECLLMVRKSASTLLAGQLKSNFIFDVRTLPLGFHLAALSASKSLLFSSLADGRNDALAPQAFDRSSGSFEWRGGDDIFDAAYWKLFVWPRFLQQPWTIIISENREEVLAPMARFRQSFPLIVLLASCVVLLTSLIQIRRTLGPLESLHNATQQIARRDFKIHLDVRSGDEFEKLASGFNSMAQQLDRQFNAMEELHLETLTALARAIDAKSEWTAGHTERVTVLAIEIGREMGLSEAELNIMHIGGLLHDVGKIGIPPEILDKPGKLTPEEMKAMMNHVRIGVRIIEPIAGFASALSIVAQHHEWYDGHGYPAGLQGEQITLHARIFAVADCFDALTSDRPYREGLPTLRTLAMMQGESGTHFDPAVMDVFLRMRGHSQGKAAQVAQARAGA
jgi:HD-GYP domain-containing protein (c-di-GMP phosphodiesterase class II)